MAGKSWQLARVLNTSYRERLLSGLSPSSRALLRSQAGARAGEYPWRRPVAVDMASQAAELGGPAGRPSRRLRPERAASQAGSHI